MRVRELYEKLSAQISRVILGQEKMMEEILLAFFCGGHVLLEGVPGTAKTLTVKVLAEITDCAFSRIQFTPDMMASDVVGTHVFDMKTSEFYLKKGPIFANLILADEINRTSPKTQSALLEAMEERQATIEGVRIPLEGPFNVFATQNPVEFEGTYPLPEAQMDRFMMKVLVEYPERGMEIRVLKAYHEGFDPLNLSALNMEKVNFRNSRREILDEINSVKVNEGILDYIYEICARTRKNINVSLGASPRAGIALLLVSKTRASIRGRDYVIPDDVKDSAFPVLRHRLILRPEAEIGGIVPDDVIGEIISKIEVPR